jgi:hypothetical protein
VNFKAVWGACALKWRKSEKYNSKKNENMATYVIRFMLSVNFRYYDIFKIRRENTQTKLQFTQCLESQLYYFVQLILLFLLCNKTRITCETLVPVSNELLMDFDPEAGG